MMLSSQLALFEIAPSLDGVDAAKLKKTYSADIIAMQSKVRQPLQYGGALWVCVGSVGTAVGGYLSAYQVVEPSSFSGPTYSYNEKTGHWREGDDYPGDFARNDPMGFYHGMVVKAGGHSCVMHGPEQRIPYTESLYAAAALDEEPEEEEEEEELSDGICPNCERECEPNQPCPDCFPHGDEAAA